jgi:hypothetical protein
MRALWLAGSLALFGLAPPISAGEPAAKTEGKTYQVPYRLTDTHHIMVRVKINGKGPYNFIIDTGAPALYVAHDLCKKLDIKSDKKGWGDFDRFEIEGGVVESKIKGRVETPFQLVGMNALGLPGVELHGIIGFSVLARYRMELDFTRDKMAWTRLNFVPPPPERLGKGGKGDMSLDALGTIIKVMAVFIGKRPLPEVAPRGFLGLEVEDGKEGVTVKRLLPGGPAAKSGLHIGDQIIELQGKKVATVADLERRTAKLAPGDTLQLAVRHRRTDGVAVLYVIGIKAGEGL